MTQLSVGCVLLDHTDPKQARVVGRVILLEAAHDRLVLVAFPKKDKNGRIKNYVCAPRNGACHLIALATADQA